MYLQQSDYQLPSVGYGISVARTYNSNSQRIVLFGRGWSTAFDESIVAYDSNLLRFNQGDGRAIYFGRPVGSSGAFTPLVGDFHAQLTQGGNGSTLTLKDGSVQQFNSAGKLLSLVDRNGNTTPLTYGGNGFLSSVTDPFGRVLTVTTNGNGQVTSISDTLGTIASYTYGGSSELLSVTYADNSAFNFSYDGNFRLTTATDALGNIVESHTYDSAGRALTSERQGGVEHQSLNYVGDTETDVTDGLSRVTKYTFDTNKGRNVVTRVEGLCNCGGGSGSQIQNWTYDNQLNVTSMTDALGHVTSYTYDGNGNRLTQTDATGTVTYTYNQFSEVLTHTDQLNSVTTNTYDAQGDLLTTKDALNNTFTFTYNARGQELTMTDARGKVTTFIYDTSGDLTQRKDANNIITFLFYDARSRLTKVRDGLSRSTLFTYDAAGRVNKVTYPDLSFMSFTYDLAGRRTIVTDERGNPTNYGFDGAYRLTSMTDAANHVTSYGYDAMSNITSTTDALSRVTNYDYDDFNRAVKITYPPATVGATRLFETLAYDAVGNVSQRADTAGRVTSYAYDNVNRVISVTDADNKTTSFQYDALSSVTSVVDALNQQYQFAYDALARQTQVMRSGISMSFAYDEVGNRTQRTDYNGVVTNYAFDNLNRLTTITYPSRTATYNYDPLGNLTRATNENGSVYIGYDNRYRVSSFSDPFFYGISYGYDTAGNRTKLKVNGATYTSYTYDAVNRLTGLKDSGNLSFNYAYDPVNRLTSRSAPNGVTTAYNYDDLNRLTGLTHVAGPTTLINNQYAYNDGNDITSWANASGTHAYSYDPLDRLTSALNNPQPNEIYAYDGVGNRTSSHLSASYGYQPFNKLGNTATATYSYDNNGNLISKTDGLGTTTFTWNEDNQLRQVALPTGLTVNYKYDAMGRHIQRTNNSGPSERYVYDGHDVLLDLNADWSVATTYLNDLGIDNHLRQSSSTTGVSYYLTDHLSSTAGLTDSGGNLIEQFTYDSFGNNSGSARTRYGYTGRERDPDTGLLNYRARFYDPQGWIMESALDHSAAQSHALFQMTRLIHTQSGAQHVSRGENSMTLRSVLEKLLLACILSLCCCVAAQKQGTQQSTTSELQPDEGKEKVSITELRRLYETARSEYDRRTVCLRAIDAGAIYRTGSISSMDEIFGAHFSVRLPTRKEAKRVARIEFVPFVPSPDQTMAARDAGWFMEFEYDYNGEVQNYFLSNIHKGMSSSEEHRETLSAADLKRSYESAKSYNDRRTTCLRAIDDGTIVTTGPISLIDEIFGTHFASHLPTRKQLRRIGVVDFMSPALLSSSPAETAVGAGHTGWFMAVEYDYNGDIQNYYLTNLHK